MWSIIITDVKQEKIGETTQIFTPDDDDKKLAKILKISEKSKKNKQ